VCAHDTACGDAVVTVRRRWPPPHVVTTLSQCEIEQRKVSPISPSSTRTPRHRSALPFSAIEALSTPAAWTWCCVPELRLHIAVLVDLTTGALNSFSVLPSPIPLCHRSSVSSPTIGRSSHPPPRLCLREHHSAPEYFGTHSNSGFTRFSGPSPALPYARPPSPS
jgi:hypothetical protein